MNPPVCTYVDFEGTEHWIKSREDSKRFTGCWFTKRSLNTTVLYEYYHLFLINVIIIFKLVRRNVIAPYKFKKQKNFKKFYL